MFADPAVGQDGHQRSPDWWRARGRRPIRRDRPRPCGRAGCGRPQLPVGGGLAEAAGEPQRAVEASGAADRRSASPGDWRISDAPGRVRPPRCQSPGSRPIARTATGRSVGVRPIAGGVTISSTLPAAGRHVSRGRWASRLATACSRAGQAEVEPVDRAHAEATHSRACAASLQRSAFRWRPRCHRPSRNPDRRSRRDRPHASSRPPPDVGTTKPLRGILGARGHPSARRPCATRTLPPPAERPEQQDPDGCGGSWAAGPAGQSRRAASRSPLARDARTDRRSGRWRSPAGRGRQRSPPPPATGGSGRTVRSPRRPGPAVRRPDRRSPPPPPPRPVPRARSPRPAPARSAQSDIAP